LNRNPLWLYLHKHTSQPFVSADLFGNMAQVTTPERTVRHVAFYFSIDSTTENTGSPLEPSQMEIDSVRPFTPAHHPTVSQMLN
jgi:hypothetical protein